MYGLGKPRSLLQYNKRCVVAKGQNINIDKNEEILHTKRHNFFSKPDVVHEDMNTDMAEINTIKCVD